MAIIKPPPPNLGPMSQDWGRYMTEQVQQNAVAIERLGGDASNDGRVNNSTLDTMTSQLEEIGQRQSGYVTAAPITTAAFNGTGTSAPMVAREIQLPQPSDFPRAGWLAITFDVAQSTTDFGVGFFTIYVDGRIFHKNSVGFPRSDITPPEWAGNSNIAGFTGFTAEPGAGGLVRVEMTGSASAGAGLRTITASDFQVTYQYSQRV